MFRRIDLPASSGSQIRNRSVYRIQQNSFFPLLLPEDEENSSSKRNNLLRFLDFMDKAQNKESNNKMPRARLRTFEVLSYVKFKRPRKSGSQNIHLLFRLKGTLKNKHEIDVNESIILTLVYKDDCVKLHIKIYNAFFLRLLICVSPALLIPTPKTFREELMRTACIPGKHTKY
jgi:plasmid maintenance system killer protein